MPPSGEVVLGDTNLLLRSVNETDPMFEIVNGLTRVLTFNGAHFARFAEITVEAP